jgi:thiamine pyrophosphate-dependent acetolactate synthase large subunit-like protein
MHTKARKGAEVLIDCLIDNGVDTVFAYPGGATLPIHQALVNAKDRLRTILPRHEQGGGWAASSYARCTGKVGVAFATSGPGATNLVTCLADAQRHAVPMLAITGQVNKAVLGLDAFQEIPIVSVCRNITKHHFQVTEAHDIPGVIRQALSICTSDRPGPVIVDVPKDLQAKQIALEPPQPPTLTKPTVGKPWGPPAGGEHPVLNRLWQLVRDRERLADTYLTTGNGPAAAWVAGSWRFPDPALWLHSDSLGSVGFALPAALGVQVGQPGKTVIAVDTPASFIADVQELACAFCEKLPVKVLLLHPDRSDDESDTDFAMLARGFRAGSERVQCPDDLDAGLTAMLDSAGPFLLDVATCYSGRTHEAVSRQSALHPIAAGADRAGVRPG